MSSKRITELKNKKVEENISLDTFILQLEKYRSESFKDKSGNIINLKAKFDENLSIEFKLGIDGKRSDQSVKSSVTLPFGHGKKVCALIISDSSDIKSTKDNTLEIEVIGKDALQSVGKGEFSLKKFNKVLTSEKMMKDITMSGSSKTLGMAGLMPSLKTGTIFKTDEDLIKNFKSSLVSNAEVKSDKFGYLKFSIGRIGMDVNSVKENIRAAFNAVSSLKPDSFNDIFILRTRVSSTMGFAYNVII